MRREAAVPNLDGEALLEFAFAHAYNSVVITDADFDGGPFIQRCNPAFCAMTGYTENELIGQSPRILQGPDTDRKVIERLSREIRAGTFFEGSTVNYRKDGLPYIVQWNISPVRSADGAIVAYISIQQDITARVAAERERSLLAEALNAATDPVIILDQDFVIVFANSAYGREVGRPVEDLLGRSAFLLNPRTPEGPAEPHIRRVLAEGRPYRGVVSFELATGKRVHVDLSISDLVGYNDPKRMDGVRTKKRLQAEFLAKFVQQRQTANPQEKIILVGDFNAYQFNDGIVDVIGTIKGKPAVKGEVMNPSEDLVNPDMTDLVDLINAEQRYSYRYDGNGQVLDHILISNSLQNYIIGFGYARMNADFPESYRTDDNRAERFSDHDAAVAYFSIDAATAKP